MTRINKINNHKIITFASTTTSSSASSSSSRVRQLRCSKTNKINTHIVSAHMIDNVDNEQRIDEIMSREAFIADAYFS